jgi:hypothetical protein
MTPTLTDMQREIQRKFGRNMLLLQQYERLMKSLVAEQSVSGTVDELPKAICYRSRPKCTAPKKGA